MKPSRSFAIWLGALPMWMAALPVSAAVLAGPTSFSGGYTPRVPVSAFARAAAWFDPSRLALSTSFSVGSGFGGRGDALQVTRLSYQFQAPLWMSVSVGNAWGPNAARGKSVFLEGLDLAYHPFGSLQFHVHYRDVRSALQLSPGLGGGFYDWGR